MGERSVNLAAIVHPFSRVSKVIAVALAIAVCALVTSSMRAGALTQTAIVPASGDTEISSANRMVNQGSATTITVDGDEPAGTGRNTAALIRFSLPTLPAGATITDTKLRLNVTNSSTNTYKVFVMKKDWVEGEATWNMYQTSSVWDLAGGRGATDRQAPAIASIAPDSTGVEYFDLGAAFDQQVGDWMSGEEANNGIQLMNTDAPDGFDFSTHEVATDSQRPQLIITYDEEIVADTTPPETTITSGAAEGEPLTVDSATFAFSSSEANSTFECSLDGAAYSACTSPKDYTNLSNGTHNFEVMATDAAGNVDATLASRTFSVEVPPPPPPDDTTPPETTIDSGLSDTVSSSSATFAFTSTEANSTFECSVDGGAYASCTSPKSLSNLTDGSYTFAVKATDAAGNTDATPASYTWTVDTAAPDTSITAKPTDPSNNASPSFSFTSTEANSTFECKLDGGSYAACTSPKSLSNLSDGSHTFSVKATDAAGNTDATPDTYTWTVDTVAPDTTIVTKPSDPSNSTSANFTYSSSEGGVLFECKLDFESFGPCSSAGGTSYANLLEGSHTFQVRAMDGAGNVDATPASYTWTVDTRAPETTKDTKPSDPSNNASPSFSFSGTDNVTSAANLTFECKLDSGNFEACTSPKSLSNLTDGSHTFSVRAKDAAGNVDGSPATYTWTVDTVAPDTNITAKPTDPSNNASPSFSFTSNEANSTFECKLDGDAFAACTSPKSYSSLSDGSHTFSVRSTDAAGNIEATPATRTWTIETILPSPTDTSKLAWAPPVLTNPITVDVPANDTRYGNGVTKVVLASGQDARINLPSTTKVGGLWIEGGRNVVVMGGHIQPNPNHSKVSGDLGMRGIYVNDNAGVVHIEGVLIDSPDDREYDAMEIDSGGTTLQLENNRWLGVAGTYSTNHGDVLQPFGTGAREVRIDRLTASSRYQGLQLYDQYNGPVTARRVDLTARPQTSGTSGGHMVWVGNDSCSQISPYSFSEVYVTPRPDRTLGDSIWPTSGTDASTCPAQLLNGLASWPLFPAITGGVALGPPPGGEFVPVGAAGLDYVSPGYQQ